MITNEQVKNEVNEALNKYLKAWEDLDLNKIMESYSDDYGFFSIGTGKHEVSPDLETLKKGITRDLKEIKKIRFKTEWNNIANLDNVAWTATKFTITVGTKAGEYDIPTRLTAVFVKKGEKWLIVQTHYSNPNPNQKKGESVPRDPGLIAHKR